MERTGWSLTSYVAVLVSDHPVCGAKVGFAEIFLVPQPPLLTRRGTLAPFSGSPISLKFSKRPVQHNRKYDSCQKQSRCDIDRIVVPPHDTSCRDSRCN